MPWWALERVWSGQSVASRAKTAVRHRKWIDDDDELSGRSPSINKALYRRWDVLGRPGGYWSGRSVARMARTVVSVGDGYLSLVEACC